MRVLNTVLAGLLAVAGLSSGAALPRAAQGRLAAALREALDSVQPLSPAGPRSEPTGDVAVSFSPNSRPIAVLDEARRLEQERQWRRASELYQRLLDEAPNELCRRDPRLYVPIRAYIEERIAAFPPEGLAAYRDHVGRQAEELWAAAARMDEWMNGRVKKTGPSSPHAFIQPSTHPIVEAVASRFLLSARGDDALDRLATAWLERGEYGRALRGWRRLLRLCSDTDIDLVSLAAKLVACLCQLGCPEVAHRVILSVAREVGPGATVRLAGRPVALADIPSVVGRLAGPAAEPLSWPTVGGSPSQSRTAAAPARPGALAWSDVIHWKGIASSPVIRPFRSIHATVQTAEPSVTVMPILEGGRAIYPSRTGLLARDLATGKLAWEWAWPTEPREERILGPFSLPAYSVGEWACAASGGLVFCPMPYQAGERNADTEIRGEMIALDVRSGEVRWRRPASFSPTPQEAIGERGGGWFVGPPVPCGVVSSVQGLREPAGAPAAPGRPRPAPAPGEVLVAALRCGRGSEEYHLVGLRAADGAVLWQTFLASRSYDPWWRVSRSQGWFEGTPAESEGLVVACAGSGVLGAVEVATGRIQWLARYDQSEVRQGRWRWVREGWRSGGPLIAGGIAYAAPPDSDFLYAFDLDSGQLLWRYERGAHRYLAGVGGGQGGTGILPVGASGLPQDSQAGRLRHQGERKAYVVGTKAACVGPRGDVEWETSLPTAAVGRPVLGGHVLHIPLAGGLLFLDATTGDELAWASWEDWRKEHGPTWSAEVASGDLLVAGGKLHVLTRFTHNVFEPLALRGPLEQRLAAHPEDPGAWYVLGQERQWDGDAAAAVQALEKALDLAERRPAALSEDARADARRRLASSYEALARRQEAAGQHDRALVSSKQALKYAPSDGARDRLRLRVAALCRTLRRWDAAVAAYQEILSSSAAKAGRPAWEKARAALEELLRQAGREFYAPFEKEAQAALERGGEADLAAVAERYPNSQAAPLALLRLGGCEPTGAPAGGEGARRAGHTGDARQWLHQLIRHHGGSPHAPAALYGLARAYAREGARAMARGALATLRRQFPAWQAPEPGRPPAADLDVEAFLAAHLPLPRVAREARPGPPFRVEWDVRQDYGSADLHVVGDAEASEEVFFLLAGRSVECRTVRDASRRWADRPAWIGIRIENADRAGGGVRVVSTIPDTPAERAGLRPGDVILALDGQPVQDCEQLVATCSARRAGMATRLLVLRDEERRTTTVMLGDRPGQRGEPQLSPQAFLGLHAGGVLLRRPTQLDALRVETGVTAWSIPLAEPEERVGRPESGRGAVAAPGIAVLADDRGRLAAYDPATARPLWSLPLDEPTAQDLALWDHGLLCATPSPPTLRIVNPFDGSVLERASERHALAAPVFALDSGSKLCYAIGSTLGCYDGRGPRTLWTLRIPNFTAKRLWVAGASLVAHGTDERGAEAVECRSAATGELFWSVAMARGETLRDAELEPDALYVVSRFANRTLVRRLETSTGKVAWTCELPRDEELGAWEPSAGALCLGLTRVDDKGERRAELAALDKLTGASRQRLSLGAGALVSLTRLGLSLYAIIEDENRMPNVAADVMADALLERSRFRIVRIVGSL